MYETQDDFDPMYARCTGNQPMPECESTLNKCFNNKKS